ncbi:MAG: peptidoglycan editing factor PgeF [Actinomycetota bacterium]
MCRLEKKYMSDMLFFGSPGLEEKYGMGIYFTSRLGGNSTSPYDSLNLAFHVGDDRRTVKRNREKVSELLNLGSGMYYLDQKHSSSIIFLDRGNKDALKKEIPEADALVTCLEDVSLMVMGADCPLIILLDKINRLVAVIHSGWKGTVNKILGKVIYSIREKFSASCRDMLMYVGPAIRGCCYNIGLERLKEFKKVYGEGSYYRKVGEDIYIDLPALIKKQAKDIGINPSHILDSNLCTFCDDRFFSFRREGVTGRQAAIGVIRS